MFGRTLMTLGLTALLALPAHAGFGLVLPDSPIVDDPEKKSLNLVICALDPATGEGVPLERPQVLSALRYSGEEVDRSEHLSVLEEINAYGARAWTTNIVLPRPGVYQFIMQTKTGWLPEQDKFVQHIVKVQVPAYGSSEGWDKPAGISFEITPLTRPFGQCVGMAFTGQALFGGKPLPGAIVDAAYLDPVFKPNVTQPADPNTLPQDDGTDKADKTPKKKEKRPVPQPVSTFGDVQQVKTDAQGVFTFVCPYPGWWAFSTSTTGDPLQDPEGKQKPLEIKATFWVYISDCAKPAPGRK